MRTIPGRQVALSPGRQVAVATKFSTVANNTYGSSVWVLLNVILLALRILGWFLDLFKTCSSLTCMILKIQPPLGCYTVSFGK
jgi:hypothetical protein